MADFTIEFRGLDEVVAKYRRIEAKYPDEAKKIMKKAVIYAQGEIPSYPAPPPGSAYRRTGTLGRVVTAFPGVHGGRNLGGSGGDNGGQPLTRVEMMGGDVRGVIGGRLEYLPAVIGDDQGDAFVGRWWQLRKVIVGARNGIVKVWRAGLLDLFNRG
jgi:hypothetical protein